MTTPLRSLNGNYFQPRRGSRTCCNYLRPVIGGSNAAISAAHDAFFVETPGQITGRATGRGSANAVPERPIVPNDFGTSSGPISSGPISADIIEIAAASNSGAGTASGAGSATATGASLAASAGSAGGSGTATATGASTAPRAGSASGVGTASAVGSTAADGSAVGTATGQGFATAIGFSLQVIQGTGTAQGVGSAVGVSPGAVLPPVQEGGGGTGAGQPVPSAPSRFRDAIREANKPRKAKRKKTRETEATKPVTGLLAEVAETIAPEAVAAEIERQRLLGEFIDELAARIELARQVLQDEEDAAIALLLAA